MVESIVPRKSFIIQRNIYSSWRPSQTFAMRLRTSFALRLANRADAASTRCMLIIANWKMHGDAASLATWLQVSSPFYASQPELKAIICPPFPLLIQAAAQAIIAVGAQNCHAASEGAFTGEVSAQLLAECGVGYVILGHSERRSQHRETSAMVAAKVSAASQAGLVPILCVGESEDDYLQGRTQRVLREQLAESLPPHPLQKLIVAYEPVWAIGSGRVPEPSEIEAAHATIHELLQVRKQTDDSQHTVVYGGSVNTSNASDILSVRGVDGVLVGGASLAAEKFIAIGQAASDIVQR